MLVEQSTRRGTWLGSHKAQFRGKSDVGDNVDRPEVQRFLVVISLQLGWLIGAIHFKRDAKRG